MYDSYLFPSDNQSEMCFWDKLRKCLLYYAAVSLPPVTSLPLPAVQGFLEWLANAEQE